MAALASLKIGLRWVLEILQCLDVIIDTSSNDWKGHSCIGRSQHHSSQILMLLFAENESVEYYSTNCEFREASDKPMSTEESFHRPSQIFNSRNRALSFWFLCHNSCGRGSNGRRNGDFRVFNYSCNRCFCNFFDNFINYSYLFDFLWFDSCLFFERLLNFLGLIRSRHLSERILRQR